MGEREGTIGKIVDRLKADVKARRENFKETWEETKERFNYKGPAGKPVLISENTILGRHVKKAREITQTTLGRK